MRLIGTIEDQGNGINLSNFLNHKGIAHQIEIHTDRDWGSQDYGTTKCMVWIEEEDQVGEAIKWFNLFKENPHDSQFKFTPVPPLPSLKQAKEAKIKQDLPSQMNGSFQTMGPITRILLISCCLLFFISQIITSPSDLSQNGSPTLFSSPIEKTILYDYPVTYQLIDRFIKIYGYEALQNTSQLPPEGKKLIEQINHTPYWQGIYIIVQKDGFGALKEKMMSTPLFEKIRQWEIWRLITPVFLHANLLHLFFNMLWLIVLGKQIENKLSSARYILLLLLLSVFSNTSQYLMSGPNFIGFSGVLCGMLTFIWIRQKKAPWEGYQLDRTTILFMLLYILGMAALQFFSFLLEKTFDISISPGIANMAHLSGAFLGIILGYSNFFRWRPTP